MPKVTETLSKTCKPNNISKPPTASNANKLFLSYILIRPLITMEHDNNNIIIQNIGPNSSAITGKIKSVWASDILSLMTPTPGPFPIRPPDSYALKEYFIWSIFLRRLRSS